MFEEICPVFSNTNVFLMCQMSLCFLSRTDAFVQLETHFFEQNVHGTRNTPFLRERLCSLTDVFFAVLNLKTRPCSRKKTICSNKDDQNYGVLVICGIEIAEEC